MANSREAKINNKKLTKKSSAKIKANAKSKPVKKTFGQVVSATGLIVLPLIVGVVSTLITGNTMMLFGNLNQPPLAPPAWLFPVAWTVLYILMGTASYLICRLDAKTRAERKLQVAEIVIYFAQLVFNFMWTILFFRLGTRWLAFGWLIAMWLMILALICMCKKNCKAAAWCLVPYILWYTFAAYLNIMVAILN